MHKNVVKSRLSEDVLIPSNWVQSNLKQNEAFMRLIKADDSNRPLAAHSCLSLSKA